MTAVEWLIRNLMLNGLIRLTKDQHKLYKELTDLAKQMEKEQIMQARLDGFKVSGEGFNGEYPYEGWADDGISNSINNEKYYNKTYGK